MPRQPDAGAVLVVYAAAFLAICLFAALAIDLGNLSQNQRTAQNATDSAAISGAGLLATAQFHAGTLTQAQVVDQVEAYIIKNSPNYPGLTVGSSLWSTCQVPPLASHPGSQNCISFDTATSSAHVIQVAIPPQVIRYWFGPAGGVSGQAVSAVSTATVPGGNTVPCALCALNPSNVQNGNVAVAGGAFYVNGSLSCNPQSQVTVTGTDAAIEVSAGGTVCDKGTYTPAPDWSAPPLADPLASLSAGPDYSGLTAQGDCNSGTASPGIYRNIGGTCALGPGLYVVTGTLGGGGTGSAVTGRGVTVFFTCGTAARPAACTSGGQAGGAVTVTGQAGMVLSACTTGPCSGSAWAGMVLWYDRNDTSPLTFTGNGDLSVIGTVYAQRAALVVKGTPATVAGECGTTANFCSQMVVGSVGFSGQGNLAVSYTAGQNVWSTRPPELCSLRAGNC